MTAPRVHSAHEVCRNTPAGPTLARPFDAEDLRMGLIDRPGSEFCGECSVPFDDPEHGIAVRCGRKGRHVCQVAPSPS